MTDETKDVSQYKPNRLENMRSASRGVVIVLLLVLIVLLVVYTPPVAAFVGVVIVVIVAVLTMSVWKAYLERTMLALRIIQYSGGERAKLLTFALLGNDREQQEQALRMLKYDADAMTRE